MTQEELNAKSYYYLNTRWENEFDIEKNSFNIRYNKINIETQMTDDKENIYKTNLDQPPKVANIEKAN